MHKLKYINYCLHCAPIFHTGCRKFFHDSLMVWISRCLIWCGKILKTSTGSSFWKLEGKAERADRLRAHFLSFLFKFCEIFLRYCLGNHVIQEHKQITRLPETIKKSAVVEHREMAVPGVTKPVSSQEKKGEGSVQRGTTRWL